MSIFHCIIFFKSLIKEKKKKEKKKANATIKNDQISLYWFFNKIMKGPGISFRSPALSPNHVRNVCHTAH